MGIYPALQQYFTSLLNFKHFSQDCDVNSVKLITILYCFKRKNLTISLNDVMRIFFCLSEAECSCCYFEMLIFLFFLLLTLYICQLTSLSPLTFCVSHFSSSHSTKSSLTILLTALMISCFNLPVRLHLHPSSFFIHSPPHFPSDPHALLFCPSRSTCRTWTFNTLLFHLSLLLSSLPLPVLACCVRQWQRRRLCVKTATKKTR